MRVAAPPLIQVFAFLLSCADWSITHTDTEGYRHEMNDKDTAQNSSIRPLGCGIHTAAEVIECSPGHVRNLIKRKELPAAKIGRRVIIRYEDLRALLARKCQEAA